MEISSYGYVNLAHIFVIVPLLVLLYVAFINKWSIPDWIYFILFLFGIFGIIYHSNLLYNKLKENKECYRCWANIFHILLVFPLFIMIGYKKDKTKRYYLEMLLLLAIAAFGYHLQSFIRYELIKSG